MEQGSHVSGPVRVRSVKLASSLATICCVGSESDELQLQTQDGHLVDNNESSRYKLRGNEANIHHPDPDSYLILHIFLILLLGPGIVTIENATGLAKHFYFPLLQVYHDWKTLSRPSTNSDRFQLLGCAVYLLCSSHLIGRT